MEQSELKIPEDLRGAWENANNPCELVWSGADVREAIECIAALRAKLATLGRKISDEEWLRVFQGSGYLVDTVSTRLHIDALISARVAELSRKP